MKTIQLAGRNWQWSDADTVCAGYLTKHWPDVLEVMNYVPHDRRKSCVQAGGNFGVWPYFLSFFFREVMTFEPEPTCFSCLQENVKLRANVRAFKHGLADRETGGTWVRDARNHGAQYMKFDAEGTVCIPLDSLNLTSLDLLDLDIEGAEAFALEGAKHTIAWYKPIVVVEDWQKNGHPGHHIKHYGDVQSGAQWLAAHGYRQVGRISQDSVFAPQ